MMRPLARIASLCLPPYEATSVTVIDLHAILKHFSISCPLVGLDCKNSNGRRTCIRLDPDKVLRSCHLSLATEHAGLGAKRSPLEITLFRT